MSATAEPEVTILVTPREKWSVCNQSLDDILQNTARPYRMIYVDAGSPAPVQRHVAQRAREHGFEVLRRRHYMTPNAARLLGLSRITTPYVVFIDNDVVVKPGWLEAMLDCARQTGAAVVSPMVCQGSPAHEIVHCAGGECGIKEVQTESGPELHLFEHIRGQGRRVEKLREKVGREPTGLAEFHCMLVRTDFARLPGAIDAGIMNTREHVDFCMTVAEAGGTIWLEPDSIVTYLHDTKLTSADLPYFMLRWSDEWERRSLERVIEKRQLSTAGTMGKRLTNVGWRRRQYIVEPFAERVAAKIPIGRLRWPARSLVVQAERGLNGLLTRAHAWRARGGSMGPV